MYFIGSCNDLIRFKGNVYRLKELIRYLGYNVNKCFGIFIII